MDSEQRNLGNQNNLADSAQNELDLGLNKMEPITPKKAIGNEPSLLERAKTLFNKKPQTAVERKEPTLRDFSTAPNTREEAFVPSTAPEEHHVAADPIVAEEVLSATTESTVTEENSVKATASQAASAPKATLASPENWKILSILPQKHRRIFVALCILLILLLFILLMKPSSETVQSFEQQNSNNIPIQFQQLDQTQENEATVLDAQTASSPSSLEITQPNITTNTNSEAAVAENKGVDQSFKINRKSNLKHRNVLLKLSRQNRQCVRQLQQRLPARILLCLKAYHSCRCSVITIYKLPMLMP